jgi:uncharacterized protein (DUF342 family)
MEQNNEIIIRISEDNLQAFIKIPPELTPPTKDEIDALLQTNNIIFGINETIIMQLINGTLSYNEHLIAQGIAPTIGEDSKTEFYFNTIPFIDRPHLKREDDSIDYHDKGIIGYVLEDTIIAKTILPTVGVEGTAVTGEIIAGIPGKLSPLTFDKTVKYSDSDLNFSALVSGHPMLKDNQLIILTVFEIENVDLSTGDISYEGDILIHKDVSSGFNLKTEKNIEIRGSIHHSNIYAGGNISCVGGKILGEEGILSAGGNITIPFVDGGWIEAGDSIIIQKHLINTQVTVKNALLCNPTEGLLLGGKMKAENLIQTFILGCENETRTEIILNNMTERLDRLKEIEKTLKEYNKELHGGFPAFKKLEKLISTNKYKEGMDNEQVNKIVNTYKHLLNSREKMQKEITTLKAEKEELLKSIKFGISPELYVYGTVYPKVFITINNARMVIKNALNNIKFTTFNNEINVTSLKEKEEQTIEEESEESEKEETQNKEEINTVPTN